MLKAKGFYVSLAALLLSACTAAGTSTGTGTDATGTQASIIVQALSPVCTKLVTDQEVIPKLAKDLGVTEKAVCDCGLRRTEAKFKTEPQLLGTILTDRDQQIEILTELGADCSQELLQQALQRGLNGGQS